jgi:hypothetical protein
MRKRWIKPVVFGLVGLVAAIVIVSLCLKAREPSYGGHRLSYWFHELPITEELLGEMPGVAYYRIDQLGSRFRVQREEAMVSIAAIQAIGTNGLPFLLRKLVNCPSPLLGYLRNCALKYGIKLPFPSDPPLLERKQAATALLALSPLPSRTVDQLQKVRRASSSEMLFWIGRVLVAQTNNPLRPVEDWQVGSNTLGSPRSRKVGASGR